MKNFDKKSNSIFKDVVVLSLMSGFLLFYELIFIILNNQKISILRLSTSLVFGFLIIFIWQILHRINKIIAFIFLIFCMIKTALLYILESYIYVFFRTFMPFDMIVNNAVNVVKNYGNDTAGAIAGNIYIIIIYFLPIVILIAFYKKIIEIIPKNNYKIIGSLVIIVFVINVICSIMISKNTEKDFNIRVHKNGLINAFLFSKSEINDDFNVEKVKDSIINTDDFDYNVIDFDFDKINKECDNNLVIYNNNYIQSILPSKKNKYTGIFKGKNLIMMCVESFSKFGVSEDLTPTLYRLIHSGLYFSDAYMSTVTNSTTEGEYQLIIGQGTGYGYQTMEKTIGKNNYYTMANFCKREGYNTACFHNGNYYYYNRNVTHENLGYDYFLANGNGLSTLTAQDNSDMKMFDKTFDLYSDKIPFSVYYMTHDGHLPYNKISSAYSNYGDLVIKKYGEDIEEEYLVYLSKMISFDRALENLIKKLDEKGILNDTVIAFTSDHYPYGLEKNTKKPLYDLYGKEFTDNDIEVKDQNSFVIWSACLENELKEYSKEIKQPVNSFDMLPTLLNLFGFDFDSRLLIGRDIFSDSKGIAFWGNESFITDKIFYNSVLKTVSSRDGSEIDDKEIEELKNIVKNKLKYSKYVLESDYFSYLFKNEKEIIDSNDKTELENNNYTVVTFGRQGGENIEWYVLETTSDKRALLLSKKILANVPYGGKTWGSSEIRKYANEKFLNESFNEDEKKRIIMKSNDIDKVSILSLEEYQKYFGEDIKNTSENEEIATSGTKEAKNMGLYTKYTKGSWYDGNASFWLKDTLSSSIDYISTIEYNGHINLNGYRNVSAYIGFRPAIWISID